MRCSTCGRANRAARRFCAGCGAALAPRCGTCGFANEPGEQFCGGCGTPLHGATGSEGYGVPGLGGQAVAAPNPLSYTPAHLAERILRARSALEGERKPVTVLFVDIKGSMDVAAEIDPEDWHTIMDGFFAILGAGVHAYEGTINQYTGDGIMALFGAPLAHEDHALRACFAALQLKTALAGYAERLHRERGQTFAVRMGLNSGVVVVGKIGDDLRMDYTAQGHTVGLAARMEQLAPPGQIYLSAATAELVADQVALTEVGTRTIKGVRGPMMVFELTGVQQGRARLDTTRRRASTGFVGRTAEVAALAAALERVQRGTGQVVGIVGEAGVGKSRLCLEFLTRARAAGVAPIEVHCPPHTAVSRFGPIAQLVRALCAIGATDSAADARARVAAQLAHLASDTDDAALLCDLLGIADPGTPAPRVDPDARQRRISRLVVGLVRAHAQHQALVILIDDLQWIDRGGGELVGTLVEQLADLRALVVANFRPEYTANWMGRPYYQHLVLAPLAESAGHALLSELLDERSADAGLREWIYTKTAGNPFFMEEVVRTLRENGVLPLAGTHAPADLVHRLDAMAIPATVHALLAARIDRLPEDHKWILQIVAVIGEECPTALVEQVVAECDDDVVAAADVPHGLADLVTSDFLRTTGEAEARYSFRHPLTQEVAYRSQLTAARTRTHAAVARAMEQIHGRAVGAHAALLAHHWEQARQALPAVRWHRRAGTWAGARDRRQALHHWQRVRALLATLPESAKTLEMGIVACTQILHNGIFLGQRDEDDRAVFAEAAAMADRLGVAEFRVLLLADFGIARLVAGAVDEAVRHLGDGLALAEQTGNPLVRFMIRVPVVRGYVEAGRLREAIVAAQEADALCGGNGDLLAEETGFSPLGVTLGFSGAALTFAGNLDEAGRVLDRALDIGQARNDHEVLNLAHSAHAHRCRVLGDASAALQHAQRALAIAETAGSALLRFTALGELGASLTGLAQPGGAVATLDAALDVMRRHGRGLQEEPRLLSYLADAHLASGDPQRALDTAREAHRIARARHVPIAELMALLASARARLASAAPGDVADIDATLAAAAMLMKTTGAQVFAPLIAHERAAHAGRQAATHPGRSTRSARRASL